MTTVWYAIEYSLAGADDWFKSSSSADTLEGARIALDAAKRSWAGSLDLRMVKCTLSEEPVV